MTPERFEHLLALVGSHIEKQTEIDYESQYPLIWMIGNHVKTLGHAVGSLSSLLRKRSARWYEQERNSWVYLNTNVNQGFIIYMYHPCFGKLKVKEDSHFDYKIRTERTQNWFPERN